VQGPHQGDHHHPSGLIRRALAVLTVALAAAPAAGAAAPRFASLPSPLAPLSASPPLSGGAAASAEGIRHRVSAATLVRVSIDGAGKPFALTATQVLEVGVKGDYFFTIGAPALDVEAGPGSESAPGLRSTSILWAGFDPGHRRLSATVVLDPPVAAAALPLRLEATADHVTLVNATSTAVDGFTADAEAKPLLGYLAQLRHDVEAGGPPTAGGASITSPARAATYRAFATLRVRGTIGGRPVDRLLGAAPVTIAASGAVRLTVEPVAPLALLHPPPGLSGRALLERVTLALLGVARARQFDTYLGNPDPTGRNRTTYIYRSAKRPVPTVAAAPVAPRRSLTRTLGIAAALLGAAAVGLVVWSRA
jgi:hypothetical protein